MNGKKMIIVVLLLLSVVVTTSTFAYWATSIEGTSSEAKSTLQIGTGSNVETKIEISSNTTSSFGELVPAGQAINSGDFSVEEIVFSFDIEWMEVNDVSQIVGEQFTGYFQEEISILIQDSEENDLDKNTYSNIYNLIQIRPLENNDYIYTLNKSKGVVSYEVTLKEPANLEEYQLIKNSTIQISFNFTIGLEKQNESYLDITYMIADLIRDYKVENDSYPRSWGDYAYLDLELDPNDYLVAVDHFVYTPRGDVINLSLEDGYELTVLSISGEELTLKGRYNWNIIYDVDQDNWYFREVNPENEISIETMIITIE